MKDLSKKEFQQIFKKYYQMLCRFAYIMVQCREAADDIVQKTFISFWENRNSTQITKDLKSYLYKMVKNNAYNYLKSIKTRNDHEIEYALKLNDSVDIQLDDTKFIEKLKWAIAQLPEQCRIVYCLKYMEGLSYAEISEYLSISENTISNHIQKALKMLKKKLYSYKDEFYTN